ncbi:fungal-specific transcription factor domain-containing protein [Mycena amicta]|nr:fungal-specific transcription factor domain-containing protein [Mycena amicta]
MPGRRCSNCIAFGSECTHSYLLPGIEAETRSRTIEGGPVPQRSAQEHISAILSGSQEYTAGDYQVLVAIAQYARRLEEAFSITTTLGGPDEALSDSPSPKFKSKSASPAVTLEDTADTGTGLDSDDDGVLLDENVPDRLRQMVRNVATDRFYGRSSSINFVKALMQVKMEATGVGIAPQIQWARPQFWSVNHWEIPSEIYLPQIFPEPDLFESLVKLYFLHVNPLVYVLHAQTFDRAVAAGLHLVDQKFGAVVLAVCAIGAKLSDDPRALLEGTGSDPHSAGWRWWCQVRPLPASFATSATLYELQLICLSALYLGASSTPEVCWTTVGAGIRMASDVGAHRRMRSSGDTIQSELYKRAFWVLLLSDAIMSHLLGRPRGASWNEVDLEYPDALEGEDPIVRPYSAHLIKLLNIQGQVQDMIYSTKNLPRRHEIVANLDSALNQWADSIPEELRWDPNQPNPIRLNQSAMIYTTYYHTQIHLHRPFIQPRNPSLSATSFPSLAICWNAARSCGHVMEMQCKNGHGLLWSPHISSAMFDSATVLLMSGFHRSRPTTDENVLRCLNVLRVYETRWQTSGRLVDILAGMLEVGKMPASLKRTRGAQDETTELPSTTADIQARDIAGSTRVNTIPEPHQPVVEEQFYMPLRTEDLGRLPTFSDFNVDSSSLLFYPDSFTALHSMSDDEALFHNDLGLGTSSFGNAWDAWGAYTAGV